MNPIRFAAGVEDAGDEPLLVEFTVVECIGAGAKNAPTPAVGTGMDREWVGREQNNETVVFGEDGLGFRAGTRQMVGKNAREGALGDSIEDSQGLTHNPLTVRMRARAVSGESAFSG